MTETRDRVLALLRAYPALHVREVERRLGFSNRLASYHLEALEAEGIVQRVQEDGFTRFLLAEQGASLARADLELLVLLRRPPVLRMCLMLLQEGEATPSALGERLGIAKPSVSHHLSTLRHAGLVEVRREGRERWNRLRDPEHLAWVLATYPPLPEDLDGVSRLWRDLVG